MPYCTKAEVRQRVAQGTTTVSLGDTELDMLIEQASRYFDLLCGVAPEYFEPVEAGYESRMSEQVYYGDGTHYLRLDPFVEGSIDSVDLPEGYTAAEYIVRGQYLVRSSNGVLPAVSGAWWPQVGGWSEGVAVTVTAVWGYSATPADVKMAVIEMVINLWRETDPAELQLTDLERQPLREKLPPRVAAVAKQYQLRQGPAFV